jgi:hypothetical protein
MLASLHTITAAAAAEDCSAVLSPTKRQADYISFSDLTHYDDGFLIRAIVIVLSYLYVYVYFIFNRGRLFGFLHGVILLFGYMTNFLFCHTLTVASLRFYWHSTFYF